MAAFFAVVILVAVLAAVVYPLAQRIERERRGKPSPAAVQELLDRRETILAAMAELEYDRKLGNVNDEEYRRMRADYEADGIAVLRALDERAAGLDAEIDRAVREARAQGSASFAGPEDAEPAHPVVQHRV
jgi:hypothetical protein